MEDGGKVYVGESPTILIHGARCSECDYVFTADEFWPNHDASWPIPCSEELVRTKLIHPRVPPWNGCGGILLMVNPMYTTKSPWRLSKVPLLEDNPITA